MKRGLCWLASIFVLAGILSGGNVMAQDGKGWIEAGMNFSSSNVSSSPVAGFSLDRSPGFGLRVGKEIFAKGLNIYGGFDVGSNELRLAGRDMGSVDPTSFTVGLRYHFTGNDIVRPYIGAGIRYQSYDGGSLGNGTLRMKESGNFGLSATAGIRFDLNKTSWKNDAIHFVNIGVTANSAKSQTLETLGGAKVTDLKSDSTVFMIGVGREF